MYKSKLTLFSQIAHLIDRELVRESVLEHQTNKHCKGFYTWDHLLSMVFCHLSNSQSIRDVVHGMCSTTGNLHHVSIRDLPRRSTLSYANQHRDWRVFQSIYLRLFEKLRPAFKRRIPFKIHSRIYLLDSTIIPLSLEVFDWAVYRKQKGAMKLHTLLDYQGALPSYLHITDGKQHDMIHARQLSLPKGSVVVADRGYFDFDLLQDWDRRQGVRFVVRAKKRFDYRVLTTYSVSTPGVVKDQLIELTGITGGQKYPRKIRRVEVWDEDHQRRIILLTNVTSSWTAQTISNLYKARWEIELFFKDLKQHLKIKSFIGTSLNAVLIQIWTALITLLLLKYLKEQATFNWHLSNLVSFIRFNLLVHVNLYQWLNEPIFTQMRGSPDPVQLSIFE